MPRPEPKRLTPELAAEVEKNLEELSRLKHRRAELSATIAEANDFLNDVEKRLAKLWSDLDGLLDSTL